MQLRIPIDATLTARLLRREDAPALYALIDENREHLATWLDWVDGSRSVEATEGFVTASLEAFAHGRAWLFGLEEHGTLHGTLDVRRSGRSGTTAEIGYMLARRSERRGVVSRAVAGVLPLLFGEAGFLRVEVRVADGNQRSARIPERLGFLHEGTLRHAERLHGRAIDLHVYGLTAAAWHGDDQKV